MVASESRPAAPPLENSTADRLRRGYIDDEDAERHLVANSTPFRGAIFPMENRRDYEKGSADTPCLLDVGKLGLNTGSRVDTNGDLGESCHRCPRRLPTRAEVRLPPVCAVRCECDPDGREAVELTRSVRDWSRLDVVGMGTPEDEQSNHAGTPETSG